MWKTTVWPLCSTFSNGGYVFLSIKSPLFSSIQDTPSQGTVIPSLVPNGQVVSEEKFFERNNITNGKNCWKKAATPTWLNGLKPKFEQR